MSFTKSVSARLSGWQQLKTSNHTTSKRAVPPGAARHRKQDSGQNREQDSNRKETAQQTTQVCAVTRHNSALTRHLCLAWLGYVALLGAFVPPFSPRRARLL
jgi:hypothetical protein